MTVTVTITVTYCHSHSHCRCYSHSHSNSQSPVLVSGVNYTHQTVLQYSKLLNVATTAAEVSMFVDVSTAPIIPVSALSVGAVLTHCNQEQYSTEFN